jgi:NAD(P)-dependent dehydrogenase (short-subunit alcohol dehydrogenase family)
MKNIVITGSTRGIGLALARAFLKKGCALVISGRSRENVEQAVKQLREEFPGAKLAGFACDVRDYEQVQALWDQSLVKLGVIDVWINNAGISNQQNPFWQVPEEELRAVVETNLLGEMFGSKVAVNGFLAQEHGALYNLEGMGARDGRKVSGLSIYGATKAGIGYFNQAAAEEMEYPKILVCALQPGMVLTDMVMNQYESRPEEWKKVEKVLRAISADVEVAAEWLAMKVLVNQRSGVRFKYGGMLRIMGRMLKLWLRFPSGSAGSADSPD